MNDTNGWIDVRDRLPTSCEWVLTWDVKSPLMEFEVGFWCAEQDGWFIANYQPLVATHWLPIPTPPSRLTLDERKALLDAVPGSSTALPSTSWDSL